MNEHLESVIASLVEYIKELEAENKELKKTHPDCVGSSMDIPEHERLEDDCEDRLIGYARKAKENR